MFTERTSLIIPTKNRSDQIIGLFNKLILLNLKFNEIIVVDSSVCSVLLHPTWLDIV